MSIIKSQTFTVETRTQDGLDLGAQTITVDVEYVVSSITLKSNVLATALVCATVGSGSPAQVDLFDFTYELDGTDIFEQALSAMLKSSKYGD